MTEDDSTLDLDSGEKTADAKDSKRNANLVKAGIGIGIGSAAIVAAMLYATHNKKKKED